MSDREDLENISDAYVTWLRAKTASQWPAKPTFLPLMCRPCRSVEKESAETCMRALLERTCAELRLKNDAE